MTLTDAGPIVALISRDERNHARCVAVAAALHEPMLTTWPCFTEAMHLLLRANGYFAQEQLWRMVRSGALRLHLADETELARMDELMEKYRDTPMDLR